MSKVAQATENMSAHAKNLGHNIQEILSDNGEEFDNENVRSILQKTGIIQGLTAPVSLNRMVGVNMIIEPWLKW